MKTKPPVDNLGNVVSRKVLEAQAINAGAQPNHGKQSEPVPVQDLRSKKQHQHSTRADQDYGERKLLSAYN